MLGCVNMTDRSFIIKKGTKVVEGTSASSVQSDDPVVHGMAFGVEYNYDKTPKRSAIKCTSRCEG